MSDSLTPKKIKIAIVAGEKSGDELGGPLMESLKQHFQDISFIGVGGEKMRLQGLSSFFPMEKISVMGIIEPLFKLRELLSLRRKLKKFLFQLTTTTKNIGFLQKKLKNSLKVTVGKKLLHFKQETLFIEHMLK